MPAPHRHRILGTAGHIDHGKTALVRALTGIDCDRLPEEKERGITVELGFAPLDLGDGTRLSVIDVPGHEGLVRTMVAGAMGIDVLLLVVAADEGVMPQTREHAAIARLLGITSGVVALTKCDAADEETAELAEEEARDLLAGSALADAPIVHTSSTSGLGIDALRAELLAAVDAAPARTVRSGTPRLAIDRSFVMKGFGTVVTGTLVGGAVAEGDAVEVLPGGARGRIRGIECHSESVARTEPGVRCALNLQGIELADAPRGATVAPSGRVGVTRVIDAHVAWLREAPALDGPTSVLFLAGTAERAARIAPVGGGIAAGGDGFVRIHLEHTGLPLLPGDRFVLRGFSPGADGGRTLGGGEVLDVAPPHRRLSSPRLAEELAILRKGIPAETLRLQVERAGLAGVAAETLAHRTGLDAKTVEAELETLPGATRTRGALWLSESVPEKLAPILESVLARFHEAEPLLPGMPLASLRGALPENVPPEVADAALARLAEADRVRLEGKLVRLASHEPQLSTEDEGLVATLRQQMEATALTPPTLRDWCEQLGIAEPRLRDLLAWLERTGEIVRAPGDLFFHAGAVDGLRDRVRAHLAETGEIDTATYKGLIGATRKHVVPLMELFDEEKLTARRGDVRVLRKP